MADRKELVCDDCDWIGSPIDEPDECPNCLSTNLSETGSLAKITTPAPQQHRSRGHEPV